MFVYNSVLPFYLAYEQGIAGIFGHWYIWVLAVWLQGIWAHRGQGQSVLIGRNQTVFRYVWGKQYNKYIIPIYLPIVIKNLDVLINMRRNLAALYIHCLHTGDLTVLH